MKTTFAAVSLALLIATAGYPCDPQLDIASVSLTSRGVWRGIELGPERYANADVDVALCGPRAAEKGPNGLELSFAVATPITDDGIDMASATLRYLRFFGEGNSSRIGAGYTQYHWGNTTEEWSGEVFVEATHKLNIEIQGVTFWPYAEVAHDFQLFEATYARAGVQHILGMRRIAVTIDTSVSASDYVDSFEFHAAEASAWADWTARGTLEIGAGAGYVWAAEAIGRDGVWLGVRVRIR